jgi:hypothetical protein
MVKKGSSCTSTRRAVASVHPIPFHCSIFRVVLTYALPAEYSVTCLTNISDVENRMARNSRVVRRVRRFGGTYCLSLQVQILSQARNHLNPLPDSLGFLLGLLSDTEDGSDMFLRTARRYSPQDCSLESRVVSILN